MWVDDGRLYPSVSMGRAVGCESVTGSNPPGAPPAPAVLLRSEVGPIGQHLPQARVHGELEICQRKNDEKADPECGREHTRVLRGRRS